MSALDLGVRRVELAHERLQLGVLGRQQVGLDARALEAHAQLGEVLQALALGGDAAVQHLVGLFELPGVMQRVGQRAEHDAARVREMLAEAVERVLAGHAGVVEPPERRQRLDLRADGDAEDVRVRVRLRAQVGERALGVGQRVVGAAGEQPDVGAGRVQDPEREVAPLEPPRDRDAAGDLGLGVVEPALALVPAGQVVARDRLLPAVAGRDRELERVLQPLGPPGDADGAEHHAGGAPHEHAQRQVTERVGERHRGLGVAERVGVGAGEERQLRLQRGQLGARDGLLADALVGFGGERQRRSQVTAVERDRPLQRQCAHDQRVVARPAAGGFGAHRDVERAVRVLPVRGPGRHEIHRHAYARSAGGGQT